MLTAGQWKRTLRRPLTSRRGTAAVEFAFILPILAILVFAVIDFGRYIQARLIVTNVSREGANLASRHIRTGTDIIDILQSSASPLVLSGGLGKICVSSVKAGGVDSRGNIVDPSIDAPNTFTGGGLSTDCRTRAGATQLGLSNTLYEYLVYDEDKRASDIRGITVVEVYYKYRPITPLPRFITGLFLNDGDGSILGSRAVFCTTGEVS
jgi:hypothetical protein